MVNPDIQKHLRSTYNPDGSPLRNHQLKMLDILKYVDNICRKNGISYWLSSGTCLGAVRHGGFIPWDDDVDIEMMREDYIRFINIFKENDDYVLQTYKNDRFYSTPFAKVRDKRSEIYDSLYKYRGIFIDVFCLEYSSLVFSQSMNYIQKVFSWYLYNYLKRIRNKKILFVVFSVFFLILKRLFFIFVPIIRLFDRLIPNKTLRHTYGVGWVDNIRMETDIFPIKYIHFEDTLFPVPGDYDKYLTRIYGNYMTIPSAEKIAPPHVQFLNQ